MCRVNYSRRPVGGVPPHARSADVTALALASVTYDDRTVFVPPGAGWGGGEGGGKTNYVSNAPSAGRAIAERGFIGINARVCVCGCSMWSERRTTVRSRR